MARTPNDADIVERLRDPAWHDLKTSTTEEAADEIERLRAELERERTFRRIADQTIEGLYVISQDRKNQLDALPGKLIGDMTRYKAALDKHCESGGRLFAFPAEDR